MFHWSQPPDPHPNPNANPNTNPNPNTNTNPNPNPNTNLCFSAPIAAGQFQDSTKQAVRLAQVLHCYTQILKTFEQP